MPSGMGRPICCDWPASMLGSAVADNRTGTHLVADLTLELSRRRGFGTFHGGRFILCRNAL